MNRRFRAGDMSGSRLTGLILAAAGVSGCAVAPGQSGETLYRENCAACHGDTGAGDGALGAELPVEPADLRVLRARNGGVYPAEYVMATIHGYRGKDHDGLMPAFGDDFEGTQVLWTAPDGRRVPTPEALIELADYVETLQSE
jgi:mono/diheme cytochrome c family protein